MKVQFIAVVFSCSIGLMISGSPRPTVAQAVCDSNDAQPTLDKWQRATELYKAKNYSAAIPLFQDVYNYFGNCVGRESAGWRLYNHYLWTAEALDYMGHAYVNLGDKQKAKRILENALERYRYVENANGARPEDANRSKARQGEIQHALATIGPAGPKVFPWVVRPLVFLVPRIIAG